MGDFRIVINAVGGHGCDRTAKDGDAREGCGSFNCPDCLTVDFVKKLRETGSSVGSAELIHWPKDSPSGLGGAPEIIDNLLTGIRKGAFLFAVMVIGAMAFFPLEAFAQDAVAVAQQSKGFDWAGLISEAVLAVIGALALAFWRRQNLTEERRKLILTFGDMAYGVVNEVARRSANTIDDKAALGLRYVLDLLTTNGQKPLTPGETATVKALFDANHGNEAKRLEAVAAAAPKVVNIGTQPAPASP